jgi:putative restriction endonuclease
LDLATEKGRRVLRAHLKVEGSSKLIKEFRRKLKDFSYTVCHFDFQGFYGELGRQFIECHHIKPVSEMQPGETTALTNLVAVCSNCHRMLHRKAPPLTVQALKSLLAEQYQQRATQPAWRRSVTAKAG